MSTTASARARNLGSTRQTVNTRPGALASHCIASHSTPKPGKAANAPVAVAFDGLLDSNMPVDRLLSTLLRSLQTYTDQQDTPRYASRVYDKHHAN